MLKTQATDPVRNQNEFPASRSCDPQPRHLSSARPYSRRPTSPATGDPARRAAGVRSQLQHQAGKSPPRARLRRDTDPVNPAAATLARSLARSLDRNHGWPARRRSRGMPARLSSASRCGARCEAGEPSRRRLASRCAGAGLSRALPLVPGPAYCGAVVALSASATTRARRGEGETGGCDAVLTRDWERVGGCEMGEKELEADGLSLGLCISMAVAGRR